MQDICCSCGYGSFINDERQDRAWRIPMHSEKTRHFSLDICPLCGAPIEIHLVH